MAPFVFGVRNNMHIIDAYKTIEKLEEALAFLASARKEDKTILFVGAKVETKAMVRKVAEELDSPYVTGRWIGGLFTNYKVVKNRIEYFRDLEEKVADTEEMEKYTKREQLAMERQLEKLEDELGGIKQLRKLPDVLFVSDIEEERIAVDEANAIGIPVVALVDTNGDPTVATYPVPVNNSAVQSVKLIYTTILDELKAVKPVKKETGNGKDQPEADQPKAGKKTATAAA